MSYSLHLDFKLLWDENVFLAGNETEKLIYVFVVTFYLKMSWWVLFIAFSIIDGKIFIGISATKPFL